MKEDEVNSELTAMRGSAMNMLAAREHSILELRRKLFNKLKKRLEQRELAVDEHGDNGSEGEKIIEAVLQQLLDDKLLNEDRFAESFVRSRINKGFGPVKIKHELNERGISNDLINDHLETSYDFWQQHIEAAHHKRFGVEPPKDYKEQSRQSRFLYQRGFSGELIHLFFN